METNQNRHRSAISPGRPILVILLFANGIIYGLHFVANKWANEEGIPIFAYVFWYCLLSGAVLLTVSRGFRELPKPRIKDCFVYLVMGMTGIAAPIALLTWIAPKLPASAIGLVVVIAPIFTYIFSMVLKIERFSWISVTGILLGFGSVLLIYLPETSLPDPSMSGWLLLALLAPISFAATNVFAATIRPPKVSSLTMSTGILLGAAVIMLPAMILSGQAWHPPASNTTGNIALIIAIFVNVTIWWIFLEIVRNEGPIFFTPSNYVVVLSSIGWGVLILDENPSLFIWGAVVLMFLGVGLVSFGQKSKTIKKL